MLVTAPEALEVDLDLPPRVQRLDVLADRAVALVFDVLEHLLELRAVVQVAGSDPQDVPDALLDVTEVEPGEEHDGGDGSCGASMWSESWLDICLWVSHVYLVCFD